MIFKNDVTVDVHDVDFNGVARASSLMRYIQSAAQNQLTLNGMSYDQLKDMNRAFILSKIKMEFTETVRAYDALKATTYPCESRGFTFLRCYTLEKNNVTIGKAVSMWALIDIETKALVRVNNFDLNLAVHEPHDLLMTRVVLPQALTEVGTYTVNYGDLDQNEHMNNTRYPDVYSNFLPLDGYRIKTMTINYMNEAPRGERLHVFRCVDNNGIYYFRTVRSDGKINTEAEIELTRI